MALKIVKASEPILVDRIITTLYAPPGVGKSTLGFSAESPLLLDFDGGAHRAAGRKDSVRVSCWGDVARITPEDMAPYKTIIVDTAGRALEFLAAQIMNDDPKARNRAGSLTLPGFGALRSMFAAWLSGLTLLGKDVVLIVHSREERKGDEILERLDAMGSSKDEIHKVSDAMGRIVFEDGKRWLNFSPSDVAFGKNPGRLPKLEIPHIDKDPDFLASVIAKIKAQLNSESAAMREAREKMEGLRASFAALETPEQFTEAAIKHAKSDMPTKSLLNGIAKQKGMRWVDGAYRAKEPSTNNEGEQHGE
jgi:hypothetical protein